MQPLLDPHADMSRRCACSTLARMTVVAVASAACGGRARQDAAQGVYRSCNQTFTLHLTRSGACEHGPPPCLFLRPSTSSALLPLRFPLFLLVVQGLSDSRFLLFALCSSVSPPRCSCCLLFLQSRRLSHELWWSLPPQGHHGPKCPWAQSQKHAAWRGERPDRPPHRQGTLSALG